jgi:nitroreductase
MTDSEVQDRIALLRGLRAVREFRPEPVPQAVVDDLLEVARWTGSARNYQPWEIVLIRDREMLRALAEAGPRARHLAGAPLGMVIVMSGNPDRFEHETFDEGRLSERLLLAAAAHGVGGCIGWYDSDEAADAKALLDIPQERLVRTALSFGYPDVEAQRARQKPPQARKPLAGMVYQEKYS